MAAPAPAPASMSTFQPAEEKKEGIGMPPTLFPKSVSIGQILVTWPQQDAVIMSGKSYIYCRLPGPNQ
jgi:hypothetical protein